MDYTVKALAEMAGVSTRTLRYYDAIGLLAPQRIKENGYRVYGQKEVDLLQQILFYRTLEMPLEDIRKIICSNNFNACEALHHHLAALIEKKNRSNN